VGAWRGVVHGAVLTRTVDVAVWAVAEAGFLIERLVEPLPTDAMRERWPDDWDKLHIRPGFLVLQLVKRQPAERHRPRT
jgi:hypothetical protein